MRLIDADALECDTEWDEYYDGFISFSRIAIDCAPTIEAEPIKHGKWMHDDITKRDRKVRMMTCESIMFAIDLIRSDIEKDPNGDNIRNAQAIRELSEAFANVWRCDYHG